MSSGKAAQILNIDPPAEIVFKGPFTDVVTSYLELANPSDRQVCFKVKTTAPKQYCVRPNSGFIPSKGNVKVAVMLQPFDFNAEDKTSKHKFMVQSAYVPEGESSLDNIWKNAEISELMDSKLRVLFEPGPEPSVAEDSTSKLTTPQKQANNLEAELRKAVDDKKRLQSDIHTLEKANSELQKRLQEVHGGELLSKPASEAEAFQGGDVTVSIWHVILVAIVALLLGLIFGKVF